MTKNLPELGVTVEVDEGYIQFYPAEAKTCTHAQTGRGGIKKIMTCIWDLIQASGETRFYFDTEGCERRERIYKRFLSRKGLRYIQDMEDPENTIYFSLGNESPEILNID